MRNVNFVGTKFKKIEDEEQKERKKREQNLYLKRKLLKDEFTEIDELEKHTAKQQELIYSLKGSTEVEFKKELDVQIEIRGNKQKQLEELEKKLQSLYQQPGNSSDFGNHFSSRQDNAFATKSQYSTKQFSTIFSKSYYRSNTMNILSQTQMNNKQEIEDHLVKIKKEIDDTQANIENEQERTHSIQNQLEQLFKTKQKIKHSLGEIESLTEAADRRFDNLQRIQFLAQEKETSTFKQLNKIKSELTDQDQMRQTILQRYEEQREREQQGRKENEEVTGNILIKIDELQKQYNQTKQELQEVLSKERKIIKKRMQSKYILKYIEFFESFRDIFLGEQVKEDKIKKLYDAQDVASMNEIKHFDEIIKENNAEADNRSNYSANSSILTPRQYEEEFGSRYNDSPSRLNRDSIKEQDHKGEDNSQIDQKVERTELINQINNFLEQYPDGLDSCVENVFRILNEMRYQQETNNEKYEILLKAKTSKTQDFLEQENNFLELEKNNPYVEVMKQNKGEEQRIENIQEAFDAGYIKVNNPRYPLVPVSKDGEELANKLSLFTTVNILQLSDTTDFRPMIEEIKINKNFFFNFFMNYGDSIVRMCKIVKTIFKKILQNSPSPQMNKRCTETIKYIQSIWNQNEKSKEVVESASNFPEQNNDKTSQQVSQAANRHKSRFSIDNIQSEQLELLHQQQEKALKKQKKRKILVEKFSLDEISNLYKTIFGEGFDKEAEGFFQEVKNDRLVWFFCTTEIFQEFLMQKLVENDNDPKKAVDDVAMHFIQLEDYASQEYNDKLNALYNQFVGIMNQIKQENQEIIEDLGEKNITYNPNRIYKQNDIQVNPKISQAIENAIKRQNEYLFSHSDNVIAKDEGGPGSPTTTNLLHHNLLNNRNNGEEQQSQAIGSKDGSRLQQIIDYISSVPSSRQREAAKKKYIIPQSYGIKSNVSGGGNQNTLSNSNMILTHGNISNQQISITVNPSQGGNRGTVQGNKELLPLQLVQQNSSLQQQQLQGQQLLQSQSQNNMISSQQSNQANLQQLLMSQTASTIQNTQSTAQNIENTQTQRLSVISQGGQGILKRKSQPRKTLDYKSVYDLQEDNFIEEESKKQKQREKQEHIEFLMKEKEKNKKLLQIEKEKEPNAQFKIIQNLNQRLTQASETQNMSKKTLRQFSQNQKVLSKIDRLDRNYDPSATTNNMFNNIRQENKNIYKSMVQQEQDERLGSEDDSKQQKDYDEEDEENFEGMNKKSKKNKNVQSAQYLKSTNSMEQRKKAAFDTIRQLESERLKNIYSYQRISEENSEVNPNVQQHEKLREKGKSSEKNRSTVRSWKTSVSTATHSKRPDTQQYSSAQNINSQFYSSQNQKFFQKYTDNEDRMPNIKEKGHIRSLDKRTVHSSKSSNDITNKDFKFQQNQGKNKQSNKSEQYQYRIPQTSDAKFNSEFKTGEYDRANFYDFPFFSHPMSVTNNSYNIPMFPFMSPPNLNLYTPTGLLASYAKNENINIVNSQSYF